MLFKQNYWNSAIRTIDFRTNGSFGPIGISFKAPFWLFFFLFLHFGLKFLDFTRATEPFRTILWIFRSHGNITKNPIRLEKFGARSVSDSIDSGTVGFGIKKSPPLLTLWETLSNIWEQKLIDLEFKKCKSSK